MNSLGDFIQATEQAFLAAKLSFGHGTDNAWDEAVALARAVLTLPADCDRSVLTRILTSTEINRLNELTQQRIESRIPVPYLVQEAWFAGYKFYVDERVIIPRSPMGELITTRCQPWLGKKPIRRILDLCTGSGCIAIACAHAFPEAKIDAIDISTDALAVAEKNIEQHACADRVTLYESDLFKACPIEPYDIILSNPPYVDAEEMACLSVEYQHEPMLALAAGVDGLDLVRQLLKEAPQHLTSPGYLFVEVGHSQTALREQYPALPFTWLNFQQGGEGVFLLMKEDEKWRKF